MSTGKVARREFLLACTGTLATSVLAACASAPATPKQEAPTEPAPTTAPARQVTISFMGWGDVEEDEGVRAAIELYQLIFLRMGLWLPSQTALMTDAGMEKWYTERKSATEGVHPPGYDQIVKEYVPKYGHVFYWPPGFPEANAILTPAIEAMWIGDMTAEEAMKGAVPQCNEILKKAASTG